MKSVVVLTDHANPSKAAFLEEAQTAARRLGLEARMIEVRDADELEPAFTTIAREHRAVGVVLMPSSFLVVHRISYGPHTVDMVRRVASYVANILKGAKLADLPIEQPMNLELVINLKTAKALGLTILQSLLLPADLILE